LDSKESGDKEVNAGAPHCGDYLTPEAREFFAEVRAGLDLLGIEYRLSPRLVRGLDYYCHTAFEFVTTELGAQGTVLGGGRYDGLMAVMGGPDTPGVGWAAGIERLAMLIPEPAVPARPIAIIPVGEAAELPALKLAESLRAAGLAVDQAYSGNLGKRMKRANRIGARFAVLLVEDELKRDTTCISDL